MLGLLLLYFIGKYFYKLAEEHNKSQWGFAILGVVVYYAGTFIAGLLFGIIYEIVSPGSIESINDYALGLMVLPFGLLSCYILYYFLKKSWEKSAELNKVEIEDIGKPQL